MKNLRQELLGIVVHKQLKRMVQNYGIMMTGVPPIVLGQIQAQRSYPGIDKSRNLDLQILYEVTEKQHMITKPAQSCGQASNDVCELLLGEVSSKKFNSVKYEELSENGKNLKKYLENPLFLNKSVLIRFELDREKYPSRLIKINTKDFNPYISGRNNIFLTEEKLYYLDSNGNLFNLGQNKKNCDKLYHSIESSPELDLFDPILLENPEDCEDFALCEIAQVFERQKAKFNCWIGSHSLTMYIPYVLENNLGKFKHYQAYLGSYTLQDWMISKKGDNLSRMGINPFIEKLALLAKTNNIKERSGVYAELFAKRGKEKSFCGGINERISKIRVKFKIVEINPNVALNNLQKLQNIINSYPGNSPSHKVQNYNNTAIKTMTYYLENLLKKKSSFNSVSLFGTGKKTVVEPDCLFTNSVL